jgi:ketosteroid isomerase-like protein
MEGRIALVRDLFSAFDSRDLDAALELVDDDVEFMVPTADVANAGDPYRGHEGIRRYFGDVDRVWEELQISPHDFREVGDYVLVTGRVYARGEGGFIADSPTDWVIGFDGEKIVSGRVYTDRDAALEAVGLKP